VHHLIEVVPDSPLGIRERAIILTTVLTGRRRAAVIGMKAGNLILDGDRAFYTYRGKGGKQGHRELPQPTLNAIRASLGAYGKKLATCARRVSMAVKIAPEQRNYQRNILW
jgi:integrase